MEKAIDILINYLTCDDPVVRGKWIDILNSFYHKSEGEIIESYNVEANGDITLNLTDKNKIIIEKYVLPNTMPINFIEGLQSLLNQKVNAVVGKQLSDENFTLELKQKLESLENYVHPDYHQISEVEDLQSELDKKVDKIAGKQLSDQNYTLTEKQKLASLENYVPPVSKPIDYIEGLTATLENITQLINTKVTQKEGKQLSSNDFTNELLDKLLSLNPELNVYNLSNNAAFLNHTKFNQKVYGVLLEIPEFTGSYFFEHNLNIDLYLELQVWQNGLPYNNPRTKSKEDLSQLVYQDLPGIGKAAVSRTPVGVKFNGSIQLTPNTVEVTGNYRFPSNTHLYIEFTKN